MKNIDIEKRNYGIDLLRIVSMIMIVILHLVVQGGIVENSVPFSIQKGVAELLETITFCAVNTYALITGYVCYGKRHHFSKLLYLYFQVGFYTIITTLVFLIFNPETINLKVILGAIFPFAYNTYWYFTAYFCLFFIMPFLDIILDKFEKKLIDKLVLVLFIVFSLLPTIFMSDFTFTKNGSSLLWLTVLYIYGGYIKKYRINNKIENCKNIFYFIMCVIIVWISKIAIGLFSEKKFGSDIFSDYFLSYVSPFIVCCSVFLILFFINLKPGRKLIKFTKFFAPVSFGVYLIHEEPLIANKFIYGSTKGCLALSPFVIIPIIIGLSIVIWFICSMIDKLRSIIFKIIHVEDFCMIIENNEKYVEIIL